MVFGRPSRARYHKFMSFPDFPPFLWIFEENVFLGGKYAEFMKNEILSDSDHFKNVDIP